MGKKNPNPSTPKRAVTFDTVREIARGLPGAVEGISYGTPAFRVGKSLFVRQHQDDDSLVVKIDHHQRTMRMKADPHTFYIVDHYLNYPWILVSPCHRRSGRSPRPPRRCVATERTQTGCRLLRPQPPWDDK